MKNGSDLMEIKTMEGWEAFADKHENGSSFDDYCRTGDYVDESIYEYFLNAVPPRKLAFGYLQAGEAVSHKLNPKTKKCQLTYTTFVQRELNGRKFWRYCGDCFVGEIQDVNFYRKYDGIRDFLKKTYRISPYSEIVDFPDTRPRILCSDGFEMSVQAGNGVYCLPRANLESGEYTHCEVGYPNQEEELLMKYAENPKKPRKTVYAYVPVDVIDKVVEKHGGYFDARVPVL